MESNFSHPVKPEQVVVGINPKTNYAEVHKKGCNHSSRMTSMHDFNPSDVLADDYYIVAPCARRK